MRTTVVIVSNSNFILAPPMMKVLDRPGTTEEQKLEDEKRFVVEFSHSRYRALLQKSAGADDEVSDGEVRVESRQDDGASQLQIGRAHV